MPEIIKGVLQMPKVKVKKKKKIKTKTKKKARVLRPKKNKAKKIKRKKREKPDDFSDFIFDSELGETDGLFIPVSKPENNYAYAVLIDTPIRQNAETYKLLPNVQMDPEIDQALKEFDDLQKLQSEKTEVQPELPKSLLKEILPIQTEKKQKQSFWKKLFKTKK